MDLSRRWEVRSIHGDDHIVERRKCWTIKGALRLAKRIERQWDEYPEADVVVVVCDIKRGN